VNGQAQDHTVVSAASLVSGTHPARTAEGMDVMSLRTTAPAGTTLGAAPVVPGSLLLGSTLDLRRDMLGLCEQAFQLYGDAVRFRFGPPGARMEMHMLFHPDAAHQVLAGRSANYRKENVFYSEIRSAFGDGLLTTQDAEWQRQKRYLQPLFVARRVNGYATAMTEQVQQVAQRWRARSPGTVDLHQEMTRLTLATVCRILFGEDLGQALPVVQRTFGPMGDAVRRRALAGGRVPRSWPTGVNRQLRRAQHELQSVCDQIIADRRASGGRPEDLLGLLLDTQDQGNSLADAEVRDQVLVFLLAGHETTSTALTYTLHLLGRHPDVQHRVRAEVDTIAGDRVLTAQDVSALGYTTMVLKEAMRLYPSAPFLGRQAVQDDQIGGYHIPAGADVVLAPWITHRHPAFWEQPDRFDPQRFTPEQEKARHRYAWFPFGGGPRACIGQHFSMLESVIALAALVRDFQFAAPPGEPARTNHITLQPTHGVPSHVTAR
jgi:cytochrome P450